MFALNIISLGSILGAWTVLCAVGSHAIYTFIYLFSRLYDVEVVWS